jgi:hypothetical protein
MYPLPVTGQIRARKIITSNFWENYQSLFGWDGYSVCLLFKNVIRMNGSRKYVMDGAYNTQSISEKFSQILGRVHLNDDYSEDLDIDGRIILNLI